MLGLEAMESKTPVGQLFQDSSRYSNQGQRK